jgi:hypothetical protein
VDSESGGAKGHYPNCSTTRWPGGSKKNIPSRKKSKPRRPAAVEEGKEIRPVPKPPQSTPHSDIDGVHQDEDRNVDTANRVGEDSSDLKRAGDHSKGRPPYVDDQPGRDDRSR